MSLEYGARMNFDEDQARAVELLTDAPIGVITGPPGVGKTTTLKAALDKLARQGMTSALCAPTGKAARRMREATGRDAKTIHRLLEWSRGSFNKTADNPLEVSVVFCDESSMIDLFLAADLLAAVDTHRTRIVFIGDADQLPPVGPGAFFRDLIASEQVPVVRLRTLHRSSLESWVCRNAPKVLAGNGVELEDCRDFEWHQMESADLRIPEVVGDIITSLLQPTQGASAEVVRQARDEIQVLSPMKVRDGGTGQLNLMLQKRFNPNASNPRLGIDVGFGDFRQTFYVGDRVIQTKNNYDLWVMNGEIGEIDHIGADVRVRFGDEYRVYKRGDLIDLMLAYAITIHKSQGSEYQNVIVVCHSVHSWMLTRQLLYTAITRAKSRVFLVGDEKGLKMALQTVGDAKRRTLLKERLRGEL